jgi:hypothetical protein
MTSGPASIGVEELTVFLGLFFDRYMTNGNPTSPDIHPVNVLRQMKVKSSKKAETGLRMAVADCLEMTAPWTAEQIREADRFFGLNGAVTLSELKQGFRAPTRT